MSKSAQDELICPDDATLTDLWGVAKWTLGNPTSKDAFHHRKSATPPASVCLPWCIAVRQTRSHCIFIQSVTPPECFTKVQTTFYVLHHLNTKAFASIDASQMQKEDSQYFHVLLVIDGAYPTLGKASSQMVKYDEPEWIYSWICLAVKRTQDSNHSMLRLQDEIHQRRNSAPNGKLWRSQAHLSLKTTVEITWIRSSLIN